MGEVLTWQEIERRYPDEWVLLDALEITSSLEVLSGRVVFHSRDEDEVGRKSAELRLDDDAVAFTGRDPFGSRTYIL
jgi:hypothetical protein